MAKEVRSYQDPLYASLDAATEKKLSLPAGLLSSIRTNGERSNSDQVSEAGARTVYQIIPATRKAAIDKWGIDPYLSEQNASEVAGLLLKESLDRNKGDVSAAAAEYHAGPDRKNWGPRTRAYVSRVAGGYSSAEPDTQAPPQSTFERLSQRAQSQQQQASRIANVLQAYRAGKMTPNEAKQFEDDVSGGLVVLPQGQSLGGAPGRSTAPTLPAGVVDAYARGQLSPQEKAELESDIRSGLAQLPQGATLGNTTAVSAIPGQDGQPVRVPQQQPTPSTSIADRAIGTGEAALTLATGATGGTLGMIGGTLKGLAEQLLSGNFGTKEAADLVERSAQQGAEALTYAPRTQQGQEQAAAAGEALSNLVPVAAVAPGLPAATAGARAASPLRATAQAAVEGTVRDVAGQPAAAVTARSIDAAARVADLGAQKITTLPRRALEALRRDPDTPTPGTQASGGSAGTDMATQRQVLAESLPVPVRLTRGQATRDSGQLKFEVETAKLPDEGARLRQRYVEQNDAILRNLDTWIDQTGAEAPSLRAVGVAVDKALVDQARADKARVRAAYSAAEKAGELERPVTLEGLVQHLNESAPDAATAPLLNVARNRAIQLGIATDNAGVLEPLPVPLKNAERYRQAISRATDYEATNVRQATIIKGLIDESTNGMGGDLYKQARGMRARYAQNYEDRATISKLLNTKRGTSDRQVAFEDVFDHSVLKGSLDDVRNVRRVLQRGGQEGQQAWRELQGQTLSYLRDQATKNVSSDASGNRVISAPALTKAVRELDVDGRLDFILGKRGAQNIRDLADLAEYAKTVPPEAAINTSNTAATLLAAFADVAFSSFSGTPAPVATGARLALKHIKDVKLRRRITDALNEAERQRAPGQNNPARQLPGPETLH